MTQFDWSHEIVVINGVTMTVKVAHVRLCQSRMFLVRTYPRENHEMVFDARDRALPSSKGPARVGSTTVRWNREQQTVWGTVIPTNMAAVDAIFVGRKAAYNRSFH